MPSRPVLRMRFRIMKLPDLTFRPLGRSKCGVLLMLKPSARNSKFIFSVIWNFRNTPRSMFTRPGPRTLFGPHVPKRGPVGCANAPGSIQSALPPCLT